jgi:hypothetical protein
MSFLKIVETYANKYILVRIIMLDNINGNDIGTVITGLVPAFIGTVMVPTA